MVLLSRKTRAAPAGATPNRVSVDVGALPPTSSTSARAAGSMQAEQHRAPEGALGDRQRVEKHHAGAARHGEPRPIVAEEPDEAVRHEDACLAIRLAATAIAIKKRLPPRSPPWPDDNRARQIIGVAQYKNQTLPNDRAQRLRNA